MNPTSFNNRNSLDNSNKRKFPRYAVMLDVKLNSMSVSNATARITDISLGGCYVSTILSVSPGENVRLDFTLPTGKPLPIHGTVIFNDPFVGFGIEFDLGEGEREFMQYFIEFLQKKS